MPIFSTPTQFVELERTFHELSSKALDDDFVVVRRTLGLEKGISWHDLLQEYRVVILSEAGSGKTEELRHAGQRFRESGRASFFLRLENVVDRFDNSFEIGDPSEFLQWLEGSQLEGWMFLDSVDEARLRDPKDFEHAIRILGRRLTPALQRVHLIISGRSTAWRPKTDLDTCIRHLPYGHPRSTESQDVEAIGDQLADTVGTQDRSDHSCDSSYKIVTMDDLDKERVEIFVNAKGIEQPKDFIDAIERADAWSFTARPQDLEELVEFWLDKGSIGNRRDLLQNSIDRRLVERDQDRDELKPLSVDRTQSGIAMVAAAVTLSKQQDIRVPDGVHSSRGISVSEVLSDWTSADCSTLLSRPIFDEALYGSVRFHHRSVREFLTARWFSQLLTQTTLRRNIYSLFFREQYGETVVVPALRPVLPWLALLDGEVCERICKVEPGVLLEGGDPSNLPLEIRRRVLFQVCDKIAKGNNNIRSAEHSAIQRLAKEDLSSDVRELIGKHSRNDDLLVFLLRMVWLGELKQALPEALAVAMNPSSSHGVQIAAFRAVHAVGSLSDISQMRDSFLKQGPTLDRRLLAELLSEAVPSEETTRWLLECLSKAEPKERYNYDELETELQSFLMQVPLDLLPLIVAQVDRLLKSPPLEDSRHCPLSSKFIWLTESATIAVSRLIKARHPSAMRAEALSLLSKIPIAHHWSHSAKETEHGLYELVPAWPELNQMLFWLDAKNAITSRPAPNVESPLEWWEIRSLGSIWRFGDNDFDYAAWQINERSSLVEKGIALSLAFRIYVTGGRPRKQRERLHKIVAGNQVLVERLRRYLHPPARGKDGYRKQELAWKRQAQARKRREAQNREKSRDVLQSNVDKLRDSGLKPGQVSQLQWYAYEAMREKDDQSDRWTKGDWKQLIPEFGNDVAQAFRDGAVKFWRHYKPTVRSEGAPHNETPLAVVFGLTGLSIESSEDANWPEELTSGEIELACRYAVHELNGFPTWFPKLFAKHSSLVTEFLLREVLYELNTDNSDPSTNYVLSDISWSGIWSWKELGPRICDMLKNKEPKSLDNLGYLLTILQGSSLDDEDIASLAKRKCDEIRELGHLAYWYAVWVGVAPSLAIPALERRLKKTTQTKERSNFAMHFITQLLGERRGHSRHVRRAFHSPLSLQQLYIIMLRYIRIEDDIHHKGVYSPELRDEAQSARDVIPRLLRDISGKEAFVAMESIAKAQPNEEYRLHFARLAKSMAESDADIAPWAPQQVRDFSEKLERTPSNHRELTELVHLRLLDLKDDLEHGDSSIAETLRRINEETEMRKFIARELRGNANGRYSVTQEEELADDKRTDIKFFGSGFDAPVPCELKLADKWTGPHHFERLENQLCGDYLRDKRSRRGFFLLVHRGREKEYWKTSGKNRTTFSELVAALQNRWSEISLDHPGIDEIIVIGIDLTIRRASPTAY